MQTVQRAILLVRRLNTPVDVAALAAFRILFGLLMAFAMARFLARGWVDELYVKPTFHFSYELFSWVKPLPSVGMHALVATLAALALGVALGFYYRLSIVLFFLGFTYVELIDKATYLNHYYLVSLLSGLMIFLPAHRAWSLDAWRRPALRAELVPGWALNVLRFQFAIVYFFAGLAKLNSDWLFAAQPLRIWLAARSDLPLLGPLLDDAWVAYAASWLGAAYDLTIIILLACRRTRPWAFAAVVVFHLATWILFRIGIFPWLMIVGALLFFPPEWPRQWLRRLLLGSEPATGTIDRGPGTGHAPICAIPPRPTSAAVVVFVPLFLYACLQLALPVRHGLDHASIAWSGRGFNWSWRVMLVEKSGYTEFRAFDPDLVRRWTIRATDYVTPRQAQLMAQDPTMIRELAEHIAADLRASGHNRVQIFADAHASLNGRPSQRLIDPWVDLAAPLTNTWITELSRWAND